MDIRKIYSPPSYTRLGDVALLLMRLVIGSAFVLHGSQKIINPFAWMGPEGFAPWFLQALAALSEFGGGLCWILGLLTPLASLGIMSTMTVAFCTVTFMMRLPFVSNTGAGSELPAAYFCVAFVLLALGPGRFSLDRLIFRRRDGK